MEPMKRLRDWREDTPDAVHAAIETATANITNRRKRSLRRARVAWAVAACAAILAIAFIASPLGSKAIAAIRNAFGLMANRYNSGEHKAVLDELERHADRPAQTELSRQTPAPQPSATAAETRGLDAAIEGVYYDGEQLAVAYRFADVAEIVEGYVPDATELTSMQEVRPMVESHLELDEESKAYYEGLSRWLSFGIISDVPESQLDTHRRIQRAVNAGQPVGWIQRSASMTDDAQTDDGLDVMPSLDEHTWDGMDGIGVRFYTVSDAWKDRESLTFDVGFHAIESRWYFDGERMFVASEDMQKQTLRVVAERNATRTVEASARLERYDADARITIGPALMSLHIELTATGEKDAFDLDERGDDVQVHVSLLDGEGAVLSNNCIRHMNIDPDRKRMVMEGFAHATARIPADGRLVLRLERADGVIEDIPIDASAKD